MDMFTLTNTLYSTLTRGLPYKLYLHINFIDVRKHFSCEHVIIPWNNLPATSEYFSSFKCFINSGDLTSHVSLGFQIACDVIYCTKSVFYLWRPVEFH